MQLWTYCILRSLTYIFICWFIHHLCFHLLVTRCLTNDTSWLQFRFDFARSMKQARVFGTVASTGSRVMKYSVLVPQRDSKLAWRWIVQHEVVRVEYILTDGGGSGGGKQFVLGWHFKDRSLCGWREAVSEVCCGRWCLVPRPQCWALCPWIGKPGSPGTSPSPRAQLAGACLLTPGQLGCNLL